MIASVGQTGGHLETGSRTSMTISPPSRSNCTISGIACRVVKLRATKLHTHLQGLRALIHGIDIRINVAREFDYTYRGIRNRK